MFSEIFLPISFFLLLGLIGNTELGGSMLNMLWSIPIWILNAIVLYIEYEKGDT